MHYLYISQNSLGQELPSLPQPLLWGLLSRSVLQQTSQEYTFRDCHSCPVLISLVEKLEEELSYNDIAFSSGKP